MIFNIIVKDENKDTFSIRKDENNKNIFIPSFFDKKQKNSIVSNDILNLLEKSGLRPSDAVVDFANLSLAVYVTDQIINRGKYGYFGWSRYFKVYIPVVDEKKWTLLKNAIEQALSFLSGDKWEINFRERKSTFEVQTKIKEKIKSVCLFSGGLDSFIGATNILSNQNVALVGHHKGGGAGEFNAQKTLITLLENEFSPNKPIPYLFHVQPMKKETDYGEEISQRARSMIFIALGLLVANSYGNSIPLIVPENGLISLNVPLTKTRIGSFSTKTTHPYFINMLNEILNSLSVGNKIENPYKFYTKGEMIENIKNKNFVLRNAYETISCSKPGHYIRWFKRKEKHCGHCTPCIIRRAAMYHAGIDRYNNHYVMDVVNNPPKAGKVSAEDYIAFNIGLKRYLSSNKNPIFHLLLSGILPGSEEDLVEYVDVFQRGLKEVQRFLIQN